MVAPVSLDAIVLLGCRVEADGRPSDAGRRRARAAAEAFKGGVAPRIVVCGGRRWHGVSEAEALSAELRRQGVPESAIVPELLSLSTTENARYALRLLGAHPHVAVVTCDWHLPRALASFQRVGFRAEGIPAPSPSISGTAWLVRSLREAVSAAVDRAVGP